jgi:hypothetical protein
MSSALVTLITLIIGLFIGLALGIWISRIKSASIGGNSSQLAQELNDVKVLLKASDERLKSAEAKTESEIKIAAQMEEMKTTVERMRLQAQDAAEKRVASETQLIGTIDEMRKASTTFFDETKKIAGALANSQTRGKFGEAQLELILEQAGLREGHEYVAQRSTTDADSSGIPDITVAMPGGSQLFIDSKFPFDRFLEAFGTETTFLVDTYNIESGIKNAISVAGPSLGGVRIDSGDLPTEVAKARVLLDELGATATKITVTNDLNEFAIASLASAPVDSYGVGTSVVTGSGVAAAGFVYKMVAYQNESGDWHTVSKQSAKKSNIGGKKFALRRHLEDGVAVTEVIGTGTAPKLEPGDRDLLIPLVSDGVPNSAFQGSAGVELARKHHAKSKADLPASALRLTKGEPAIQTLFV